MTKMKTSVFLGACLMFFLAVIPVGASTAGLIARYHLNTANNNVIKDTSGNNLSGNIVGPVSLVDGKFGRAYDFSAGGYGRIANNNLLEPAAVSVEAWVKASASPGAYKYIISKGVNGDNNASYALYTGGSGGLIFYISHGGVFYLSPDAGVTVWDNNWHYVAGTYDGSIVRLYLDGHEVGSGTVSNQPISYNYPNGNDLFIGNYNGTSKYSFPGQVDEVRIWSMALSQDTISFHALSNSVSSTLETEIESETF